MKRKVQEDPTNKFDEAAREIQLYQGELRSISFAIVEKTPELQLRLLTVIDKLNVVYHLLRQSSKLNDSLSEFLSKE